MFASHHVYAHPIAWSTVCRWGARAFSTVLILGWAVAVLVELFHTNFYVPRALLLQGIAIASVFAGYAAGLKWELAGGLLALAGTAALFAVITMTVGVIPPLAMAWFAVPGLLYIEAWHRDRLERSQSPACRRLQA